MKILYLHGFGSTFDPLAVKIRELRELGTVIGETIDYTKSPYDNIRLVSDICAFEKVDLIVGTSMGGWLANQVGELCHIPYVALNPSLYPSVSLLHVQGEGKTFSGTPFHLSLKVIEEYSDWRFTDSGCGLVLLQEGDELFDSAANYKALFPYHQIYLLEGGSHRFDNMYKYIDLIEVFYDKVHLSYGTDNI